MAVIALISGKEVMDLVLPWASAFAEARSTSLTIVCWTHAPVASTDGVEQVSWLIGGSHPQIYYNRIMKQDNNASYAHAMVQAADEDTAEAIVAGLQGLLDERFPEAQIIVAPFAQGSQSLLQLRLQ